MLVRDYLSAIERLPLGSLDDLARGPLVVLAPHPDDETLGCGGLTAAARAEGRQVEIVILTDGSRSHPNSPSHPRARLAALRRDETLCAARTLGVAAAHVHFLGAEDTKAPTEGPEFAGVLERIGTIVTAVGADALFATWKHDPHCDHEAAALAAAAVVARTPGLRGWAYPIWGLHLPVEQAIEAAPPAGFRLDITRHLPAKHAALACHASQTTALVRDDPAGFRLTEAMLAPFLGPFERFLDLQP